MTRAALYARVSTPASSKRSTRDGDRERQNPETQLRKLREFAAARGWEVVAVYVDRLSGKDANRKALNDMMKAAFRREFDVILIVRLDRIMRSIANFVTINQQLTSYGVGLVCTDQMIDTTTPAGRLQQNLLVAFAEYEREMIRERVKDGLDRARAEGKKLGRPKRPVDLDAYRAALAETGSGKAAARKIGVPYSTVRDRLKADAEGAENGGCEFA
jgi:DNA invertase Pin-like site-specific DNA recombinase